MNKIILSILIFLAIIVGSVAWIMYSIGSIIPSPHAVDYNAASFEPLARVILSQNQIQEMDDCTRHTKLVNEVPVRMTRQPEPTDADCCPDSYCCPQYYEDVLDSLHISRVLFHDLRHQLEKTALREFHKSGDSILFIVDGFLDGSWGFLYCAQPLNHDTSYFDFAGYSVKAVDSVNANWRGASIH